MITASNFIGRRLFLFTCNCLKLRQSRWGHLTGLVMVMMQRTPMLCHMDKARLLMTDRVIQLLRVGLPVGVFAGGTHAVSGATAVVPAGGSVNPADATVGESFVWVFRTTGEKAKSYTITGLPSGLTQSSMVNNGVSSIAGVPEEAGMFTVAIVGWEETNHRGAHTAPFNLVIKIHGGEPPIITSQPVGGIFQAGDTVLLEVSASGENLQYQWKKNDIPLQGETKAELILTDVSLDDAGTYQVDLTNAAGKIASAPALIEVESAAAVGFEKWKSEHLAGTSANEQGPQADPDEDGLTNLMEYFYGTEPEVHDTPRSPTCEMERRGSQDLAVLAFPGGIERSDLEVVIEAHTDLNGDRWTALVHGNDGVEIEALPSLFKVTLPRGNGYRFFRMKLVHPPESAGGE